MSALLTITEPSGTITAGQSVTYSFSFAGPYPVNWTFTQWGTTKSLTATDNSTASVTLTVPSDPNSFGGTLSFYGTGESASTYYLKPLDGFSEKMYPVINTSDGYAAWSLKKYGNTKFIPNSSTQAFSLSVSAQGRNLALTTGSFPLTVYLTSQQIYPTTGSETTVQTQTYNTLGSYASQTYTTPAVTAGTINRYKLYTTNPSATSFNADTGTTLSSCIPISNTQAPFIYVQPVNTTLPVTVLGTQYNATTIGLNYISASSSPTITWFRNGVAVPASWVVTIPNYAGFDTSITVQTSLCANGDTFYCTITDPNGTVTSSTVTLTINTPAVTDAVSVSAAANSTTLLTGKTLTLNSNANANGAVTYQWNKNGTAIVGATNGSYTASVTTADSGNIYTVTAKSGTATATSSPVTINVYAESSSYPVNFPITWSATAATVGSPGSTFNYSWKYDDGTVLLGQSVSKTQSVLGSVTGTVTAVDTTTLGTASASKMIAVDSYVWSLAPSAMPYYVRSPLSGNVDGNTVISAGGRDSGGANNIKTTYIFDGTTWTQVGDMVNARSSFANNHPVRLVKLPNGKIMAVGNNSVTAGVGVSAELYDPVAKTWALTGSMTNDRSFNCYPVLLNDGRVIVYGGQTISAGTTNAYEFYDYNAGTWSAGGTVGNSTDGSIAIPALMNDGRVFYASPASGVSRIFNPTNNSWFTCAANTLTGGLNSNNVAVICGVDGNIYLFGYSGSSTTLCGRYNVAADTWTQLTPWSAGLTPGVFPYKLGAGSYILIPGITLPGGLLGSAIYDSADGTWKITASYNVQGANSLGSTAKENGFGTLAGKPIVWCNSGDTVAPYGTPEIFNGA